MATGRKRKKVSRDAYIRSWSATSQAEASEPAAEVEVESTEGFDQTPKPTLVKEPVVAKSEKLSRPIPKVDRNSSKAPSKLPIEEPELYERESEDGLPPRPATHHSEIHSDTVLQAMDLRIDSISEALHRVERNQANLERALEEAHTALDAERKELEVAKAALPAPAPALLEPARREKKSRIWTRLVVSGLIALVLTTLTAYMQVGSSNPLTPRDLVLDSAPPFDLSVIASAIVWVPLAIGLGTGLLVAVLLIATRRRA